MADEQPAPDGRAGQKAAHDDGKLNPHPGHLDALGRDEFQFGGLDQDTIERVVDKLLVEAEAQLEQKGVSISVDERARRWIAKRGYDPKMGARPMARVIQEFIKRPLAEELLFGKLVGGGHVEVSLSEDGDKLKLETRPANAPALLSHES